MFREMEKLTEKEKEQILKNGAEAMSKIIERMSIEMGELEEENKNLNEEIQRFKDNAMQDMREITELEIENKKLKEAIKDHQLYEEKLEHRIIELEELLHGE